MHGGYHGSGFMIYEVSGPGLYPVPLSAQGLPTLVSKRHTLTCFQTAF